MSPGHQVEDSILENQYIMRILILSPISSTSPLFSNFLYFFSDCFQQYKNPEVAKRDVLNVFTHFNDLRPKQDDFGKYNHMLIFRSFSIFTQHRKHSEKIKLSFEYF